MDCLVILQLATHDSMPKDNQEEDRTPEDMQKEATHLAKFFGGQEKEDRTI